MKCTCARSDLKRALNAVVKAVPEKPNTPVIGGIYMRTVDGKLEMQATNYEIKIIARVAADIEVEGDIVFAGKTLPDIVNKMGGEIVTISDENMDDNENIEGPQATLKSEAASFSLFVMDASEYPQENKNEYDGSFKVRTNALRFLIKYSEFACMKEQKRPAFTGCCAMLDGANITFVATNTHRIAIANEEVLDNEKTFNFIIPASILNDIVGMFNPKSTDNLVTINYSDKHVAFSFENLFVESRVLEGEFPPVDKAIPKEPVTFANVNVNELRAAVARMEIIARASEFNTIRFLFSQEGLEISSNSGTIGKAEEHVDADVEGDDLDFSVNVNYINDVLKTVNNDNVRFEMTDPLVPVIIREIGNDNFTYIVTPVRTRV